jgi:hypothetical protein
MGSNWGNGLDPIILQLEASHGGHKQHLSANQVVPHPVNANIPEYTNLGTRMNTDNLAKTVTYNAKPRAMTEC